MNYKDKKILEDMLNNCNDTEERKKIIFDFIKEKRKDLSIKNFYNTLSVMLSGAMSLVVIMICKEILKK